MSRFSGLPAALAAVTERTRAAAQGEPYTGRLGSTRPVAAQKPASPTKASAPKSPKPTPSASSPPPARKLARAEVVALAFRSNPKIQGMQDIALHMLDDPDLKGLSGDSIVKQLGQIDASSYRAIMAKEQEQARAASADATWSKAWGAIAQQRGVTDNAAKILHNQARFGWATAAVKETRASQGDAFRTDDANKILATQRAFGGGKPSSDAKADSVWARAYAAIAR